MPQPRLLLAVLLLLVAGASVPLRGHAATWELEATVSEEKKTEIQNDGSTKTDTFEQSYSISYDLDVNPALQLTVDFTLDITDEEKTTPDGSSDTDTREINPAVDVDLQAVWWDLTASWDYDQQSSSDELTTHDTTYDVEFTAEPGSGVLPDVNFKFQRDRSEEGSQTQTVDDTYEGSLDYTFWDLLDITFDAKKEHQRDVDAIQVTDTGTGAVVQEIDRKTETRSYQFDVSLDRDLLENLTLEVEWSNEREQTVEYAGGTNLSTSPPIIEGETGTEDFPRDDTLTNDLRGKLTYTILEDLELSLDRELNWDKDLEGDQLDKTDTWTSEVSYARSLTDTIDIDLSYSDERKREEFSDPTQDDTETTTRDYAAALDFSPFENLTISPSFDRSDKSDRPDLPVAGEPRSNDTVDDTWEIQLDAAVWDDRLELSVTRTWSVTREEGDKTTDDRDWDVEVTFTHEDVPGLELNPSYTYTETENAIDDTSEREKKIEVNINYEISLGDVLTFTLDHTYTRTQNYPATDIDYVERDDDTDLTVTWDQFFDGMSLEGSFTRQANDKSEDDEEAKIDYTYSLLYDYEFLEQYTLSLEYEYDDKEEPPDSRNFLVTFSAEFLEGLLTVDWEYEYEKELGGDDPKETHRYLIELSGQF